MDIKSSASCIQLALSMNSSEKHLNTSSQKYSKMSETVTLLEQSADSPDCLSKNARVVGLLSVAAIVGGTWSASPRAVMLLPPVFALTGLVLYYRSTLPPSQRSSKSLETLFWMYLGTGTIGMIGLMIVQAVLAYGFAYALFGPEAEWFLREFQNVPNDAEIPDHEHKAARAAFAARPSYWLFIFIMSFDLAAGCEEGLKYLSIMAAKRYRGGSLGSHREYLIYGAFAALSFGTIENILFLMAACQKGESGWTLATTVFERVVAAAPGHMLGGISIALGVIRRDELKENVGMFRIMRRSILCHGLWDMVLLGVSALNGNLGWVHPDGISLAICYVFVVLLTWLLWRSIKSEIRALKIK